MSFLLALLACEKLEQGKLGANKSAIKGIAEPPRQRTNMVERVGREMTESCYPPLLSSLTSAPPSRTTCIVLDPR